MSGERSPLLQTFLTYFPDLENRRKCWRYIAYIGILVIIIIALTSSKPGRNDESRYRAMHRPPCGQICSYEGASITPGAYYPYIRKHVNCQNILLRMKNQVSQPVYPPPKHPPSELSDAYTQYGECPIKEHLYTVDFDPKKTQPMASFRKDYIDLIMEQDRSGQSINSYLDYGVVSKVIHKHSSSIAGGRGFVVGTERPWLEAMLLNLDASHVTTVEYRRLLLDHPRLTAKHPKEIADDIHAGHAQLFDFGASYSSLEHSGLGRYGDPLDPYGDLEAMAQVWCMSKPGALFFLAVPTSVDNSSYIVWNAHRVYGSARMQHLTANWEVIDMLPGRDVFRQSVYVLRKPLH